MTVGMNELFRAAASETFVATSNVALLWAVKGPNFDLKGALQASGAENVDSLAEELSFKRLMESENVSPCIHAFLCMPSMKWSYSGTV